MTNVNMELKVSFPDIPEALGGFANYEINNTTAIVEFIHSLKKELDGTILEVHDMKFINTNDNRNGFFMFDLSNDMVIIFYKSLFFDGNAITITLKTKDAPIYNHNILYETNVACPYMDKWEYLPYKSLTVLANFKTETDLLVKSITSVIASHTVEKIDM